MGKKFRKTCDIAKIDERLGLVFGFAEIIKNKDGEYFDTQGDARSDFAALSAWTDFMKVGTLGDMHEGTDEGGQVVFAFPLTEDIAAALDIQTETYGILVGIQPSPAMLAKFISGEYSGFSIGGERVDEEVVEL